MTLCCMLSMNMFLDKKNLRCGTEVGTRTQMDD